MDHEHSKVVLITGARSGIGRACALAMVDQGYRVYGTSRTSPDEDLGFTFLEMDVDDTASVEAGVQTILDQTGRLDVVVNNAGWGYGGAVEDTSIDEAKALFETNFYGVLRVCHAVLPTMRAQRSGLIVNVSSIGGLMGVPYQGLYSASKFAVNGLTAAMRMEVRPWNIDVVVLAPGDIRTPFTANRQHTVGSRRSEVYEAAYARALARIESDEENGAAPEVVGRALVRIVNARVRRPVYVVGPFYQKLAVLASRILPRRVLHRLIMLNYGL
ncbi:MAG: SDR family oxidoreductase [Anaerolineae bacterium]|nr:SDR family oxidoreductase [Anaerolineae bacterium]